MEEHAHLEFGEGFAAEEALDAAEGVQTGQDMNSNGASLHEEFVQNQARVARGLRREGKRGILIVAQFAVPVEVVQQYKNLRCIVLRGGGPGMELVSELLQK